MCAAGAAAFWRYVGDTAPKDLSAKDIANLPPLPLVGLPEEIAGAPLTEATPTDAIAMNAARPISSGPNPAARAFGLSLSPDSRARAVSCLAVAAVYEAGGGQSDQQAVMQVILNRARHPAFPKTICGVVFQGSERTTGCQFSFTCDGSMQRRQISSVVFQRAKTLGSAMIDYRVDPRVGHATHYHTNWVLPYWSPKLDKVTSVQTHIFFRWQGFWGTPRAFVGRHPGSEPAIAAMAAYEPAHYAGALATDAAAAAELSAATDAAAVIAGAASAAPSTAPMEPIVVVSTMAWKQGSQPGRWIIDALQNCSGKAECRIIGWSDAGRMPGAINAASILQSPPDLMFIQLSRNRVHQAYWDCGVWPRGGSARCLGSARDTLAALGLADSR